jgi:transposase
MESQVHPRKPYPTDGSDEEWQLVASSMALVQGNAPQRSHDLREVCNALRWIVPTGAPWRHVPGDFTPWEAVWQQTRRWLDAGVFATMVHDLRTMLRWAAGGQVQPSAVICDSATRQATPESGHRAGYDGHQRRKGSKIPSPSPPLGELLAVVVTPANAQEREQGDALAAAVQEVTGQTVAIAFLDQGYTGEQPAQEAAALGIPLAVVRLAEAKRSFVLLPRRWVVESSFAWASRFRRLANDDERLPEVLAGLHVLAFACLMLQRLFTVAVQSP